MAAHFFLGVTEAGFFPAAVTLVGDWYPHEQLQSRISGFLCGRCIFRRFGWSDRIWYPLPGRRGWTRILEMVSANTLQSSLTHRIFILEGIATCCMVSLLFFVLPDYPSTTKWLTVEEKEAIVASRAATGST